MKRFFLLDPANLKSCAWKLFAAALAVKLALAGLLVGGNHDGWVNDFHNRSYGYDDFSYYWSACKLLEYHAFLAPKSEVPQPTVYRTPGYPLILAVFAAVSGKSLVALFIIQAVALSAIPIVFFFMLREMHLRLEWAWLFALDPLTNILSLSLMTEDWLILALLLSVFCWLRADRLGWRFASLLLFSLSLLIKPTAQFFLLVFLVLTLIHFRRRGWTVLLGALAILPLVLWMYRNQTVCGKFLLSTQTDNQILAVKTIEAKQQGVPNAKLIERIVRDWQREHGESIFEPIMDNKIDFAGTLSACARAHPLDFTRYHVAGMAYVMFGTARTHVICTLRNGRPFQAAAGRMFDGFILVWYAVLYATVLWRFRVAWLRQPMVQYSILFILYNLALIGVLAYTTGGGLKRIPFIPLLYFLLAFSFSPTSPEDKPLFPRRNK
jgi:hypothetical protein